MKRYFQVLRYVVPAFVGVVGLAGNALAVDPTIADLFAGVNIAGVGTAVLAVMLSLIAIDVLFLGRKYLRKGGVK